jgi:hypothetical protein
MLYRLSYGIITFSQEPSPFYRGNFSCAGRSAGIPQIGLQI